MRLSEEWFKKDLDSVQDQDKLFQEGRFRYRRLRRYSIFLTALVAITPLIIMTIINSHQYQKALKADLIYPISRQTSNTRRSLESFIEERRAALDLIIKEKNYEELYDHDKLANTLRHLKESIDGFIDLSLIDSRGNQVAYVGPYKLEGKNYRDQDWFHEVSIKGVYVSDVFRGYRDLPHFVIAVLHERANGDYYILRATIDSDMLYRKILSQILRPTSDAFLINKDGILQTPSSYHGDILEKSPIPVPPYSPHSEVLEQRDSTNNLYVLGYAFIENSPFILIEIIQPEAFMQNWLTIRNNLVWFLGISIIVILIVIVWGSFHMVDKIREADAKRIKILHQVEYTNKMASIGRLAAGVSHEINNPLAIINENAGMVNDILSVGNDFPMREKVTKSVNSILKNVERCSRITHRLLGFAKRMETKIETLDLRELITEVLGFLEKEALHRNIKINTNFPQDLPGIQSDRGQLQQVFLNILNNAIDAISE
ncbi:MAG: two-component sensor histidine kinase, partial [candidate division Zixibacteria bacterium]|nr:two-component sensor histidine kinase [candidate division Zixibacteria bacterium]NIR67787.1 two-component sensor histidine kinase [candidate division Zixibacteria bacterium]NIS17022.1 two-component sensor histidine kinase [candidate division Zixibacteria bacterium]NIS49019.1 two-component sensor histidine kinase [candidate division Zixibacteria bacterium]NIT53395.1 two-component sensor histidine kinase [candidate division Zixibacteria bacterium]